jgi:benzylsuccinate CoA-transferase BbsE subunit
MPAADGLMCLIARDGSQWKRFVLDVVGDPVLTEPRYRDRTAMGLDFPDEVDAVLAPWFSARTRNEIFELCRKHHVPFSPVRTIEEVAECEQLASRGFFVDVAPHAVAGVGSAASTIPMPGAPYLMSETPMRASGSAPRLGEHTAAVLERAGYETDEIKTWRLQGVT